MTHHATGGRPARPLPHLSALLVSAAILPAPAVAQQLVQLDPITVEAAAGAGDGSGGDTGIVAQGAGTATKTDRPILDTPAAISVVTREELQVRKPASLEQALAYTSGVTTDEYGSDNRYDFFRIRGFLAQGLGTYRDGLPQRTLSFTNARLEPYGLERLEVLKGSTSSLFGLNGPGGLVNAISKRPRAQPFGEVYTTLGQGHAEVGTDFGAPLDSEGRLAYRVTAKWQDGQDGRSHHMNDDRLYFAPSLTWAPTEDTSITLLASYYRREGNSGNAIPLGGGVDIDTYLGEPDFNAMDTEETSLGYAIEHRFAPGVTLHQDLRYSRMRLDYEQVGDPALDPATDRSAFQLRGETERFAVDTRLQFDTALAPRLDSRTLVGLDHTDDHVTEWDQRGGSAPGLDPFAPVYCGRACIFLPAGFGREIDQTVTGVYAQQEFTFDERWILGLGLRQDAVRTTTDGQRQDDDATTGRAGLTWKVTPGLSLYANYSESFQPIAGGRPQEGDQKEIGAKWHPAGTDALFTLALFDLRQSNVVSYVGSEMVQTGEITVQGLEAEAKYALTERLNLSAGYAFWDAEITRSTAGTEGNRPQLVPEHTASLWADYTFEAPGALGQSTLGAGLRYVGSSYNNDANDVKLDDRITVDLAASTRIARNTDLSVNVTNLFDEDYVAALNFAGTTAFYGEGRVISATLRRSW
ncbi:TonB-dependent siderophore receptor [Frigidibacter sp. MR17.24]|uniref:TonB-dependent siderophore receptor n=1 Tax=Frigidibacter sp. MR17.24 TaxID=3127345 RepID=UPI003012E00D